MLWKVVKCDVCEYAAVKSIVLISIFGNTLFVTRYMY